MAPTGFVFGFPISGTRRRYLGFARPSTVLRLRNEKNSGHFAAGIKRLSGAGLRIPAQYGATAAHSGGRECAIRSGAVTARRAPPARLRPGRRPASPARGPRCPRSPAPCAGTSPAPPSHVGTSVRRASRLAPRRGTPLRMAAFNTHASWLLVILINAVSHT